MEVSAWFASSKENWVEFIPRVVVPKPNYLVWEWWPLPDINNSQFTMSVAIAEDFCYLSAQLPNPFIRHNTYTQGVTVDKFAKRNGVTLTFFRCITQLFEWTALILRVRVKDIHIHIQICGAFSCLNEQLTKKGKVLELKQNNKVLLVLFRTAYTLNSNRDNFSLHTVNSIPTYFYTDILYIL